MPFKADAPRGILDVLARGMFKDRTNAVEHAGRRPHASPLPRPHASVPIQIKRRGRAAIWPGAPQALEVGDVAGVAEIANVHVALFDLPVLEVDLLLQVPNLKLQSLQVAAGGCHAGPTAGVGRREENAA